MFLVRNFTEKKTIETDEEPAEYTNLKQEIENEWKNVSQWNLNLYNEEMKRVDDAFTTEQISRSNLEKLIVDINSNALIAIDKTLPKMMKASAWDAAKINTEMAGIDSVAKVPALAEKDEVVRSKTVYKLYYETKDWINKTNNSSVSTYYNGSVSSWTNFNSIVSNTESQASKFKNSKYYKEYLANKLDKSLSEAVSHVKGLRNSYYSEIAQSIIRHYPIEDWDNYSDPLGAFQRAQSDLNTAANKLKSEDSKAIETVNTYKSKFNRSKPTVSSK